MVGNDPMRTPPALACRRALVWLSDRDVGARTTSAQRIASAISPGGSAPSRDSVGKSSSFTDRARGLATSPNASAIARCAR